MNRIIKTMGFALRFAKPSLKGMVRQWDWPLVKARANYAATRNFKPFSTKKGIAIQNASQLLAYWSMAHEPGFLDGWEDLITSSSPLILDIGSNYGMFGLLMKKRFPNARIIGFEPFPAALEFSNKLGVYEEIQKVALGSTPGTISLHYRDSDGYTGTTNTAYAQEVGEYPSTLQVDVKRLDDFLYVPDLIKCDVDGAEVEVLAGGLEVFKRAKVVIIECENNDHVEIISEKIQKKPRNLKNDDYIFT